MLHLKIPAREEQTCNKTVLALLPCPLASWNPSCPGLFFFLPERLRISLCICYILVYRNPRRVYRKALVSSHTVFLENHLSGIFWWIIQLLSAPSGKSILTFKRYCEAIGSFCALNLMWHWSRDLRCGGRIWAWSRFKLFVKKSLPSHLCLLFRFHLSLEGFHIGFCLLHFCASSNRSTYCTFSIFPRMIG